MKIDHPYAVLGIRGEKSAASSEGLALQGVQVQARLEGLLLRTTLRQRYRNTSGRLIETVYTFPLAHGASLLGLSVTLGERSLRGAVIEKQQASQRYEQAIDDGDLPVLVEKSSPGLYTANLGNLQEDESAEIELEYAQLLRFEQGSLRLSIPTVVAPRYGNAQVQGGLAPHESTQADWKVRYPFELTVDLVGPAAKAHLSSPSHRIEVQPRSDGQQPSDMVRVTLEQGAWLDRDFVLRLDGLEGRSFCIIAPDGDEAHPQAQAVLASFCPRLPEQEASPLSLKILVDCSGSMAGDSITQARRALHEIGQWLDPADRLAYFRFGNDCMPVIPTLEPCSPLLVTRFAQAIDRTEADLGGTELHAALLEVFGPPAISNLPLRPDRAADVLLITDGEVWDIEPTVQAARESGHRLFVVGVSSSPAESLLRELAEQSGGACELVTPNEDITGTITRMVRRLRGGRDIALQLDWGREVLWQIPLPKQVFNGETLHLWARLEQPLQATPILRWSTAGAKGQDQADSMLADASGTTARLVGARQIDTLSDQNVRLALALRHQLVTRQTSLFLLHPRAEGEKAAGLSALQQIPQMMAAGHGGFGSAFDKSDAFSMKKNFPGLPFLGLFGATGSLAAIFNDPASLYVKGEKSTAAVSRSTLVKKNILLNSTSLAQSVPVLKEMLDRFKLAAADPEGARRFLRDFSTDGWQSPLCSLLNELNLLTGSREVALALLLDWLQQHLQRDHALSRQAERILRAALKDLTFEIRNQAETILSHFLSLTDKFSVIKLNDINEDLIVK